MSGIRSQILARVKLQTSVFLTDTCTIERYQKARDEYRAETGTWVQVASGVACRLIKAGKNTDGDIAAVADQETMRETWRLILPAGQVIDLDYRVLHNGLYYAVTSLETELTSEVFTGAIVERDRGATNV